MRRRGLRPMSRKRREQYGERLPSSTLGSNGSREHHRKIAGLGLSRRDPEADEALRRVDRYLDWIRRQPCLVAGVTTGEYGTVPGEGCVRVAVQACHLKTRGSGGGDFGNVVPLDWRILAWQEWHTLKEFQQVYGRNLRRDAEELWTRYEREEMGVRL